MTEDAASDTEHSTNSLGAPCNNVRLDHFLKLSVSETGGQAKLAIQGGEVQVNGQIETRRRRKLIAGDVVLFGGKKLLVKESHCTKMEAT